MAQIKVLNKNEKIFINHLKDLINISISKEIITNTSFLTSSELNLFLKYKDELKVKDIKFILSGGNNKELLFINNNDNDHKVLFIIPSNFNEEEINNYINETIKVGKISFKIKEKFINKSLTHRDYLGSLLSLGVSRNIIGDIYISSINNIEGIFYYINKEGIEDLISNELKTISKYEINKINFYTLIEFIDLNNEFEPKYKLETIYVTSIRLDNVIKEVFNLKNREIAKELIEKDMVFISGIYNVSSSYKIKENERISVKNYGKFIYLGIEKINSKNKFYLKIKRFI